MITSAQIRAARALLGWRQIDLAREAHISFNTLNKIEAELVDPRASTLRAIQRALEQAGIEFIEGGVRRVPLPRKGKD